MRNCNCGIEVLEAASFVELLLELLFDVAAVAVDEGKGGGEGADAFHSKTALRKGGELRPTILCGAV